MASTNSIEQSNPAMYILADQYRKLHRPMRPNQHHSLTEGRLSYGDYFDITAHSLSTKELMTLDESLQPFVATLQPQVPSGQSYTHSYTQQAQMPRTIDLADQAAIVRTGQLSKARLSSNSPPHPQTPDHQKYRNTMTLRWVYGGGSPQLQYASLTSQLNGMHPHGAFDGEPTSAPDSNANTMLQDDLQDTESLDGSIDLLYLARQIDSVNVRKREMEYDALMKELSLEAEERKKRRVRFM